MIYRGYNIETRLIASWVIVHRVTSPRNEVYHTDIISLHEAFNFVDAIEGKGI
jgi:hypothetical protein